MDIISNWENNGWVEIDNNLVFNYSKMLLIKHYEFMDWICKDWNVTRNFNGFWQPLYNSGNFLHLFISISVQCKIAYGSEHT